jgi:hypothetical protein
VRTLWFRGREDKAEEIARCFAQYFIGTVLDVGCDGMHLRRFIRGSYIGCDVAHPAHFVIDLERGLPVATRCVDTVVALDVREHIDSIHAATSEILRAARRWAIIGLPNMYEWRFRVAYLLGRRRGAPRFLDSVGRLLLWSSLGGEARQIAERGLVPEG